MPDAVTLSYDARHTYVSGLDGLLPRKPSLSMAQVAKPLRVRKKKKGVAGGAAPPRGRTFLPGAPLVGCAVARALGL